MGTIIPPTPPDCVDFVQNDNFDDGLDFWTESPSAAWSEDGGAVSVQAEAFTLGSAEVDTDAGSRILVTLVVSAALRVQFRFGIEGLFFSPFFTEAGSYQAIFTSIFNDTSVFLQGFNTGEPENFQTSFFGACIMPYGDFVSNEVAYEQGFMPLERGKYEFDQLPGDENILNLADRKSGSSILIKTNIV